MDNAFVNRSSAEIYAILYYNIPPLKIIPEYTAAHEVTVDDLQTLVTGLSDGTLRHNVLGTAGAIRRKIEDSIKELENELQYFNENGEFSEAFKLRDEENTKEALVAYIRKYREELTSMERFNEESAMKFLPMALESLKSLIDNPDAMKAVRAIQYNSIVKLKGQVLLNLKHLFDSGPLYGREINFNYRMSILQRVLSFYVKYYPDRKKYLGTSTPMMLTPENILIGMDLSTNIIMDVSCPELLLTRNTDSLIGFDINVLLTGAGLGVKINEETVTTVPFDVEGLFEGSTLDAMPSYSTVVYNMHWISELKVLLPIILQLIIPNEISRQEAVMDVCDKVHLLATEGVSIQSDRAFSMVSTIFKAHSADYIEQTHVQLMADIISSLLTCPDENPKENFANDVVLISEIITRYVSDE